MIEYVSLRQGEARLYFSSVEERDLFLRGMGGMEGVMGGRIQGEHKDPPCKVQGRKLFPLPY